MGLTFLLISSMSSSSMDHGIPLTFCIVLVRQGMMDNRGKWLSLGSLKGGAVRGRKIRRSGSGPWLSSFLVFFFPFPVSLAWDIKILTTHFVTSIYHIFVQIIYLLRPELKAVITDAPPKATDSTCRLTMCSCDKIRETQVPRPAHVESSRVSRLFLDHRPSSAPPTVDKNDDFMASRFRSISNISSMFASHNLINGGTFTQVHGDAHYHSFRGPFPFESFPS